MEVYGDLCGRSSITDQVKSTQNILMSLGSLVINQHLEIAGLLTGQKQAKSRLTNLNLTGLFRAC
jgi:hypothetical protein